MTTLEPLPERRIRDLERQRDELAEQRDRARDVACAIEEDHERLRRALADALDGMEDMVGYVPDYFREKWDHDAFLDRARRALTGADRDGEQP